MAIYIALGANLSSHNARGDEIGPAETFALAFKALKTLDIHLVAMSGLWQSPAWPPGSDQPDYINACAKITTALDARQTLSALHKVEAQFGRSRSVKNAPRPLDLDLLDYKGQVIAAEAIEIPHPRMLTRGFVLFPLSEVAPNWTDPKKSDVEPMKRLR